MLDFINTVDVRNDGFGPDYLLGYRDLLVFAKRTGLLDSVDLAALEAEAVDHPRKAESSLARAKNLRELLYRICRAEFADDKIAEGDLRDLDEAILDAMADRVLTATAAGLRYVWRSGHGLELVIHAVALAAQDLLFNRGSRRRIRECPGRNCGWVFLDTSKGGRRRWCSDKTCGTASRISKFRSIGAD